MMAKRLKKLPPAPAKWLTKAYEAAKVAEEHDKSVMTVDGYKVTVRTENLETQERIGPRCENPYDEEYVSRPLGRWVICGVGNRVGRDDLVNYANDGIYLPVFLDYDLEYEISDTEFAFPAQPTFRQKNDCTCAYCRDSFATDGGECEMEVYGRILTESGRKAIAAQAATLVDMTEARHGFDSMLRALGLEGGGI